MSHMATVLRLLLFFAGMCMASPRYPMFPPVLVRHEHLEVLEMRSATPINPAAITDVVCVDPNKKIVFHDENVAELSICDGIAGAVTRCGDELGRRDLWRRFGSSATTTAPITSTTGESGSARFVLSVLEPGAAINVSKGRWEQCVRAARAVCPTGSLRATCVGGATSGDVAFSLDTPF
ncbi:hypothetical protein VTK73DRAFT_4970 [Phialemonium thermophilum]|uniref:Uncharacterized protein n=1 Tax=Phialemonium thermophilum TaxID=223376 RepID=A0ABR3XYN5_9PEZI